MKYNLNNPIDQQRYKERVGSLLEKKCMVELREIKTNRSLSQNRYLHLLIGWFAVEYGETMDYVKQEIFKKLVNKELFKSEFTNRKTGEVREDIKSTSLLDSRELTLAIDRFRNWSSKEAGIYLPQPNETEYLAQVEIEMDRAKAYI